MNYYNENDKKTAAWLRELIKANLIPDGEVDERSITEVQPADLVGFNQHHFFAGIGGWSIALRLAGWPDDREVWTGSCPCQPISCAGKQLGEKDQRHLWPELYRLISKCKPSTVFGEQVGKSEGFEWCDGVCLDLEEIHYAVAACDIPACSIGYPHVRQRIFWFAYSAKYGRKRVQRKAEAQIQENRALKALVAWDSPSNPFLNWREQLAQARIGVLDDGVSSELVVRPAMRGFGNAIVPALAAEWIKVCWEEINQTTNRGGLRHEWGKSDNC